MLSPLTSKGAHLGLILSAPLFMKNMFTCLFDGFFLVKYLVGCLSTKISFFIYIIAHYKTRERMLCDDGLSLDI
jgi:hypothetical protein